MSFKFSEAYVNKLNEDISKYVAKHSEKHIFPVTSDMVLSLEGVSQMVMLDRYSNGDLQHETLTQGDFVVLTVKEDPKWPSRGFGWVKSIDWENRTAIIDVEDQFAGLLEEDSSLVTRNLDTIVKPFEIFFEQIAKRNAYGLSDVENSLEKEHESFNRFYEVLKDLNFVPAGRVLYGAGAGTDVTFFNCFVMPFVPDSREGIAAHRGKVMEIMSRGGGVGTNGSTLRPKNELARGVNGKSSGSVSWLNDIAELTHLVSQGGSRRGAQMIMMADWAPDIFEFIISKMQNPDILRYILENAEEEFVKELAKAKLKFTPLTETERVQYDALSNLEFEYGYYGKTMPQKLGEAIEDAKEKLEDGGTWSVENPSFLSGANISVCLTKEFMEAVEKDGYHELRFPDVANYTEEEMKFYNEHWHKIGDVREWEKMGYAVRVYRKIKAKSLWNLINLCATYSAEPGIFFIDSANDMTNAKAYGQKVVATNPCGKVLASR